MILRRRQVLAGGLALMGGALSLDRASLAALERPSRSLSFSNLHTGEKLRVEYWERGRYLPDALEGINRVLRDFRTGEIHSISPRLLDLLSMLHTRLETDRPFQVISGYRSPITNAALHANSAGVSSHSLHMDGMAIDIKLSDRKLSDLYNAALELGGGGVGYYPKSDFVHLDVGRVRRWQGV